MSTKGCPRPDGPPCPCIRRAIPQVSVIHYRFSRIDHPRFGLIICVMAKHDISAGEEILVNYNMDMALAPEWYKV